MVEGAAEYGKVYTICHARVILVRLPIRSYLTEVYCLKNLQLEESDYIRIYVKCGRLKLARGVQDLSFLC